MTKYTVVIEKDEEDWYFCGVEELPGCRTQGRTVEELLENIVEAIQGFTNTDEVPKLTTKFVGIEEVKV